MNSIRRLTTPTHEFTLPFNLSMVRRCRITYSQNGSIVLSKDSNNIEDMKMSQSDENNNITKITIKLTQDETARFSVGQDVEIQSRVITTGGDAVSSNVLLIGVKKSLDNEVLL